MLARAPHTTSLPHVPTRNSGGIVRDVTRWARRCHTCSRRVTFFEPRCPWCGQGRAVRAFGAIATVMTLAAATAIGVWLLRGGFLGISG
jgi:hypothetical protein